MSETKTFSLTIGERMRALSILSTFKGSIDTHAYAMDDAKILSIQKEEWDAAGLTKNPTDEEMALLDIETRSKTNQTLTWNDAALKDITLRTSTVDFMVKTIKSKSDNNDIGLDEGSLVTLYKKLGV